MPDYERILITGAAGELGRRLRSGLAPLARNLRLVDARDMAPAAAHEEVIVCDLADGAAALEVTRDCDAIVHFAGYPRELTVTELFTDVLPGSYHMYEGARLHGAKRVVYASSIHAVGFHNVEAIPGTDAAHRPDTFYGLSKTFTEDLASLYWDKFGLESVCLRICSCREDPVDRRMLWSWLSYGDMLRLTTAALTAPRVGFSVIYGTSDNAQAAVSNAAAAHIGFRPQDSADGYADAIRANTGRPEPASIATRVVGGWFASIGHPDDGD